MAFRALRTTGLALGLGLTALAAYQNLRDAPTMADPPPRRGRLDPTADQEVVFCHQCQNEWFRQNGSLVCPQCDGEITEIVSSPSYTL